jgi:hypothetical protein
MNSSANLLELLAASWQLPADCSVTCPASSCSSFALVLKVQQHVPGRCWAGTRQCQWHISSQLVVPLLCCSQHLFCCLAYTGCAAADFQTDMCAGTQCFRSSINQQLQSSCSCRDQCRPYCHGVTAGEW